MSTERKFSGVVALFSFDLQNLKYSDPQAALLRLLFMWLNSHITVITMPTVFPLGSVLSFAEQ
jgi:hypothetical protein